MVVDILHSVFLIPEFSFENGGRALRLGSGGIIQLRCERQSILHSLFLILQLPSKLPMAKGPFVGIHCGWIEVTHTAE